MKFSKGYFLAAIALFILEVCIALYVNDDFIRPYIGDVLVVILIYCFVKAFLRISVGVASLCVLLFSFIVEALQYFNFIQIIGLQDSKLARTVIGNSFSWIDIVCYIIGILLVLLFEKASASRKLVNMGSQRPID